LKLEQWANETEEERRARVAKRLATYANKTEEELESIVMKFRENRSQKSEEEIKIQNSKIGQANKINYASKTNEEKKEISVRKGQGWSENYAKKSDEEKKIFGQIRSETVAKAISEGRFEPHSNYVYGHYRDIYFQSAYELRTMMMFDTRKIKWTRSVIRIPWYDSTSKRIRNYPPDFIVNDNEIWEIKGWNNEEVQSKMKAAQKFVEENNSRYLKYRLLFNEELIEEERLAAIALNWTWERYRRRRDRVILCYKIKNERKKV
jgi:hypothetical protein